MGARISIPAIALFVAVGCSSTPAPAEPEFDVDDPAAFGQADGEVEGAPVADDGTAPLRYQWKTGASAQRIVVSDTTSVTTYKGKNVEDEANVVTIDLSAAVIEPRDETYILEYTLDNIEITGADESTSNYLTSISGATHRTDVSPRGKSRQVDGAGQNVVSWFVATLETPVLPAEHVEVGDSWPDCVIWDVDELERFDIECTVAAIDGDKLTIDIKGSCGVWFEIPDLPGIDTETPIAIEEQGYDIDCTYEVDLSETLPIAWECAASGAASGKANGKPFTMTTSVKRSMRTPTGE
jgi:hypothetical protein